MRRRGLLGTCLLGMAVVVVAVSPSPAPGNASAPPSLQHLLDQAGSGSVSFNPLLAAVTCPIERGPVKEGSDASRFSVSTTVTATTIAYLSSRAKPNSYPTNTRIAPYELKTWQLRAYLTQYKVESDGDLHLVLTDSTGRHLVAEIPYGSCVPSSSRWTSQIATARYAMTHNYTVTTSWHYVHRLVDVRGLALFDVVHGQTGAASNGIELHPVTGITFR